MRTDGAVTMTWYVVDGMDGSGKTTSSDLIRAQLESEGRKVLEITHPNSGFFFGKLAARFLCIPGKIATLFSTVFYIFDVIHSLNHKKWHGKEYDDVIFVRYSMAAAYLPASLCPTAYRIISKVLPVPDVKILVDIEPETAMERILERGEKLEVFETVDKLRSTRQKMLGISEGWYVIDNSGTRESTEAQTEDVLREVRAAR